VTELPVMSETPHSIREGFARMSLFDSIREKATEMLSGATEKVGEFTGDIPGGQAVEDLSATASDTVSGAVTDATGTVTDATGAVTDAAGNMSDTAGGAVSDAAQSANEAIDPYRP
jgi:uncharacterized protein YjbJ (UPF0337 family)